MARKLSQLEFINNMNDKHSFKYDYSKTNYVNSRTKICIICHEHGEFWQEANCHSSGQGCPKCAKGSIESFILKANKIHNNKYIYTNSQYTNARNQIKIICPIHGEFSQSVQNHLSGSGCPICKSSKGELLIHNWLQENNISFKSQYELITSEIARNTNLMRIDFFVRFNDKQYFIEYDGIQHFKFNSYFHKGGIIDFEKEQRRDKVLNDFCELHKDKVTLIRFNYKQSNEEIIKILKNKFKINES